MNQHESDTTAFHLSEHFMNKFKRKKAPFGFNGLGELVYNRTYSQTKGRQQKRTMVGDCSASS